MQKVYKLFGLTLILTLTLGLFGGYVLAQTPTTTTYISPGSLIETSSYIIWKDGSNYFRKNGVTAQISTSTNASALVNTAMDALLALGDVGGKITLLGTPDPLAITLGYVANNTHLEGVGEVQITSTSGGSDEFIMREGSTLTNCFIRHQGTAYVIKYQEWSGYFSVHQQWDDFPSEGGELETILGTTQSAYMIIDGTFNTEGQGEVMGTYFRVWPSGPKTYGIAADVYGALSVFSVASGNHTFANGVGACTGAVNSCVIPYEHGRVLQDSPTNIQITSAQDCGNYWASDWNAENVTVSFVDQPGAATWYFYVTVWWSGV